MKNNNQMAPQILTDVERAPMTEADVLPINHKQALASCTEEEREAIFALAKSIDPTEIGKVMSYGNGPLKQTFAFCGELLKREEHSNADAEVFDQVVKLAAKASGEDEALKLAIQEPSFFQKLFGGKRNSRVERVQKCAVTNYQLLMELKDSCYKWLEMLKKAMTDVEKAGASDTEAIELLEKYIIAGYIAEERISNDLMAIETQYQQTGLQKYAKEYQTLKEGYDIFIITMNNLEKSRIMYYLSLGQLALIRRSNRNVQISIHTQVNNSMALIGQQLRNALLNEKTREVLKGQNAIVRLNDELIKEISKSIGMTAEQTERAMYASFYNADAAKVAITSVINSCEAIKKTAGEMLPKMKADLTELNGLIEQLEPLIGTAIENVNNGQISTGPTGTTELKF